MNRKLNVIYTPPGHQGFLGPGHTAKAVLHLGFAETDPFIMLMDDVLDKKDSIPVGGPHPHAGFETVSLLLQGEIGDGDHTMHAGDFQIMTAGSGVVHTETIDKEAKMRLLQMWLTLPDKDRWATPRVQDLPLQDVPVVSEHGFDIKVYSGSFAGVTSPIRNHVPLIIADIAMRPGINLKHSIPASFNTFLYVIEGDVKIGEVRQLLRRDQVGWLDRFTGDIPSDLELLSGESGARLILYSAQPQLEEIVSHGPFIGSTEEDIHRLYREFRAGKMRHVNSLPEEQLIRW
jgi:quercetin 2,3-dioxygenase